MVVEVSVESLKIKQSLFKQTTVKNLDTHLFVDCKRLGRKKSSILLYLLKLFGFQENEFIFA